MKVYFTCSARGEEKFGAFYTEIFKTISKLGHRNISDYSQDNDAEKIYGSDHDYKIKMYKDHMKNIKEADVLVIEVSTHSLSMGYLMKNALELGKPVIALCVKGKIPAFAVGVDNDRLQIVEYEEDSLKEVLKNALEFAKDQSDIRFNFFISPTIANFLDWVAKTKRIPRSVYLRRLIEADMKINTEYKTA